MFYRKWEGRMGGGEVVHVVEKVGGWEEWRGVGPSCK